MISALFLLLLSTLSYADSPSRHMVILGGGGDPVSTPSTIFDESFQAMGDYLKNNPWHSDILFNGGHPESENILKTQFSSSETRASFTKNNYDSLIAAYIEKIKNGNIKPGEQLMIYIDSHGAEKNIHSPERTHSISVGSTAGSVDYDTLSGSGLLNLDSLLSLQKLAEQKGIKLAILDMTCHSGNTLALADSHTCVISSTGPDLYGYSDFSESFVANMSAGSSLEDVFLKTRSQISEPAFPMISTSAGNTIFQEVYPSLSPFLFSRNDE